MADPIVPRRSFGGSTAASANRLPDPFGDLIERVATDGNVSSYEMIFRHYAPRLKAWGIRSGMSPAVAEELAQETMISLWRKADSFERSRATASRWVFAIFRNKRIDYLRRNPHRETDLDEAVHVADHGDDPEVSVGLKGAAQALRRALETLPAEQAMVLREVYFGCKSHRQVATDLNLPLGTVKSRVRLALARLRLAVGEDMRCS